MLDQKRRSWAKTRIQSLEADLLAFRSLHYERFGVNTNTTKPDTLLIMEKRQGKHLSNIANRDEMAFFLRHEFPNYRVTMVSWSNYRMSDQVRLMSRTKAMISLPGSDVMNGIFMPNGSSLVLYCRPMNADLTELDTSNERKYWFDHISYVDASTEDCDSTNVTYSYRNETGEKLVHVDLESLKLRLLRLGISPSDRLL